MSKRIELSIIIVNFNTTKITADCLRSINRYQPKVNYEIIVVDNASTDNSVRLLKKYKINLIINSQNFGFAKANNIGIKAAKGEYILLLNSDTLVTKNSLDDLLDFTKSKPDAGAVVPRLLNKDKSVQASVFRFPTLARATKQYWFGVDQYLEKYVPENDNPVVVESAVMAAFLITPQAKEKVGFLDERYFMYYEDFEYCRQIQRNGLKVYYLPSAEIIHLHGASGKNLAKNEDQWKRLIPSSKIYHGWLGHYVYNFILWSGQKAQKVKQLFS